MKHYSIVIILLFISCSSSTNESKQSEKRDKHNFVILLDLSDRLQNQNQIFRDKELVFSIFSFFRAAVKQNMYIKSMDKFKVVVAPQQNDSKSALIEIENQLMPKLDKLYSLATEGKNVSADFFGADIWQYFNDDLKTDLDAASVNHLFIITDGYIYFENYNHTLRKDNRYSSFQFMSDLRGNDWRETFREKDYGIISTTQSYPSLQVVLMEIDPKGNFLNEYELIETIWLKWLTEMRISKVQIQKVGPLDKVRDKISNFIGISAIRKHNSPPSEEGITKGAEPNLEELSGLFQGSLNGFVRELEITNLDFSNDDSVQFVYSIKGQGDILKNRKGYANLISRDIAFETLGKGNITIEDGAYVLYSLTQNDWRFVKKN